MSKLSAQQRRELPLADFGDPERRLFPIVDQDDVDSAAHLIGKAQNPEKVKACVIAIAKRKGLTLPAAWTAKASMGDDDARVAVRFALDQSGRYVEGEYAIYPNATVWVAGEYPDKRYGMTPEENWAAVEQFTPVSGNVEHTDFLAGRACHVRGIRLDADDPARIRAEIAVPLALDGLMGQRERGLSCEWNRGTKTLEGIALTTNPRISEAALMAAFADSTRHDTYDGQRTMQTIHDMAAKSGALCAQGNPNGTQRYSSSYFVSKHESTGLQAVHDAAVEHGAKCSDLGKTSTYAAAFAALFAGQRHSAADAKDIQAIHDLAAKQGADCAPAGMSGAGAGPGPQGQQQQRRGRKAMNWKFWEKTTPIERAELREAGVPVPEEATFGEIEAQVQVRLAEERAKMQAELRKAQAARLQTEAAAFADGLIRASKAVPAEREAIIAAWIQAADDDAAHGAVTFADGQQGSRVTRLQALYEARPAHSLIREQLDPKATFQVVPGAGMGAAADAEKPTADGAQVSEARKGRLRALAGIETKKQA